MTTTDLCRFNPLNCSNNGRCAVNGSSLIIYCLCDPCHYGALCENDVWQQTDFPTDKIYLIIFFVGLFFSLLNSGLTIELCLSSTQIRRTNIGVYLIAYSVVSVLSSAFLVVLQSGEYFKLFSNSKWGQAIYCSLFKIGYNTSIFLCLWFSACIAVERGLVIHFDCKINTRKRSYVTLFVLFTVAIVSSAPHIYFNCDWSRFPKLQLLRGISVWLYPTAGISADVLSVLFVLLSCALRVRNYGYGESTFLWTYWELLKKHWFIFLPSLAFAIGFIPYTIVVHVKNKRYSYFRCGISIAEYIAKVVIECLMGVPSVITWLLFIFPSKVYMIEFFMNTWSGKRVAKLWLLFRERQPLPQQNEEPLLLEESANENEV